LFGKFKFIMSAHTKEELENMLEDVVNELDLSGSAIEKHGPTGTPPAELVRLVLDQKDREIRNLKAGMVSLPNSQRCYGKANKQSIKNNMKKDNTETKHTSDKLSDASAGSCASVCSEAVAAAAKVPTDDLADARAWTESFLAEIKRRMNQNAKGDSQSPNQ
jgi:hypothetical protein